MRAIDTNVAARFLLDDDPVQSPIARATIAAGVFVPPTVLLELGWLLASRYRQAREVIAAALMDLIDLPSVTVDDADRIIWALERFAAGGDLADLVHIAAARSSDSFVTFDAGIARAAGPDSLLPIETLG